MSELISTKARKVINWPKSGIEFIDLNPYFADPDGFREAMTKLVEATQFLTREYRLDDFICAGIESRGLNLASIAAWSLHKGFVPVRKLGKLPPPTVDLASTKEYGVDVLSIPQAAYLGKKVIIFDDIMATGGTMKTAVELFQSQGADVVATLSLLTVPNIQEHRIVGHYTVFNWENIRWTQVEEFRTN